MIRKLRLSTLLLLLVMGVKTTLVLAQSKSSQVSPQQLEQFRKHVKHIVVIYQENWSFDGLYGHFKDADNLDHPLSKILPQTDFIGNALIQESYPIPYKDEHNRIADANFKAMGKTPMQPYDLIKVGVPFDAETGDLVHRFHTEQLQINGGKMDRFVAWSDNPGLVLSYYDASNLPEGKLAQKYTMCDHFFHSAFGGSYLNHMWLVAAKTPCWPKDGIHVPEKKKFSQPLTLTLRLGDTKSYNFDNGLDSALDSKGYPSSTSRDYYPINTFFSQNLVPSYYNKNYPNLLPLLKDTTIADRMNERHITWAWYAGGWNLRNDSLACSKNEFQYHHQPFAYFERTAHAPNLKDELDFYVALRSAKALPQVCFIKPVGKYNEHPSETNLILGQEHVRDLVDSIEKSPYGKETLIIIAYDENGGRWDHVAPPVNKKDHWGPGTRVPAILISPWTINKQQDKNRVDHTVYETVSILKTIEELYNLKPLTERDKDATSFINALDF